MRKRSVVTCLCAGLLLLGGSCGSRKTEEQTPVRVRLSEVGSVGNQSAQEFPGRVKAAEEVNMAFKVAGTLMSVRVEEGSKVAKGQLIAEIDPRDYRIQLEAVEAEYLRVKAEAERVMALYADSVGTADQYDRARYGLQQMAAKYENARNQLADTKIYAPFDGYVQRHLFDPPTVVAAGMPVLTLVSQGNQEIEINIPASTYIHRDRMADFRATFDFIPGREIPLRPIAFAPKANANQLYAVRLALPEGLSPRPSPGMSTMVRVLTNAASEGKTVIPSSALVGKEGRSYVYVYDASSGSVRLRGVAVERLHTDGTAVIGQGLAVGEQVVTAGVHKLTDNQKAVPLAAASETNVGGLL